MYNARELASRPRLRVLIADSTLPNRLQTIVRAAIKGCTERVVEVYALASRYGHVSNSRWGEDVAGRHIASALTALSPQAVDAARERGRCRDLEGTVEELLIELEEHPI
jgi:hypothetical protein